MNGPEERLRQRIENEGPLPFAEFMEEALYGEGGYYATATPRIGPDGDFVTGASLSPLFGAATARLLRRLSQRLDAPADLLEVGCGDGTHLRSVLDSLPPAARGRVLAWDRIDRPLPAGAVAVGSEAALESAAVRGLVFSYELFDALPLHRLRRTTRGGWEELHVLIGNDGEFDWVSQPLSKPRLPELLGAQVESVEPGQLVDLAPGWRPLYRRLAQSLERGLIVTCDYGFERDRLLDARVRRHGTLACHRQQMVHRNPFLDVGGQDITCHVDFSALIEEGEAAGLQTIGLVTQAEWLGACGLFEDLAEAEPATRIDAARLLDLGGMGTEIRVLVQSRDMHPAELFDLSLR